MSHYCNCGIKLQEKDGKLFCPRCKLDFVKGSVAAKKAYMGEPENSATGAFDPTQNSALTAPVDYLDGTCSLCNSLMESGCNKICPNCNWVSPCGL